MKKIYWFIIVLIVLFPLGIKASSLSASIECSESAKANSEVSCKIYATPKDDSLAGMNAEYDLSNATFVSFSPAEGWSLSSTINTGFTLIRTTAVNDKVLVGTLKVKMPSSGSATINLKKIGWCNANNDDFNSDSVTIKTATIRVMSGINTLEALALTGTTFKFDKNTTTYNVTIDASSTTISATKTDSNAKVSGDGKKTLNYGKNTFKVVVAAENGNKKTYTINVTRPDNRSSNNNLSTLKLDNGTLTFDKNTITYNTEVASNITSVKLAASVEDTKASFVKNYGPRTINLNYGKNTALIKVKAENGTEKVYTINITRKDDRSNNANLSSITLSSGTIDFNKDVVAYQIAVEKDIENINIKATAEDDKAKLEFKENLTLKEGANVTEIKVTAENGTTKSYKLTIIRSSENIVLDNNNYLSALSVKDYTVNFNRDVLSYNLTIKEEQQLQIDAATESSNAIVTIIGNENLKNGSKINVKVVAQDGSERIYVINITKQETKTKEESLNMSYIAVGVFALGTISFIGAIIYKNKKKKK